MLMGISKENKAAKQMGIKGKKVISAGFKHGSREKLQSDRETVGWLKLSPNLE